MAYPATSNQPGYSGVAIPEIWSTNLIEQYYDSTVLNQISNTDYEGEIRSQGDKVIIREMPHIQVHRHKIGEALITQQPVPTSIELLIDKGHYWQFKLDDVIEKQQDIDQMKEWGRDAAEQLKIAVDTDVLGSIVPDFAAENKGTTAGRKSGNVNLGATGSPVALTKTNIVEFVLNLGQVLDEQNVPESGRFLVLPFWATNVLKQSDLKMASLTGDGTTPLRNGMVGTVDRFTIYNSNLLPSYTDGADTTYHIIAGTKSGLTFATQLTDEETIRSERFFGELMRGLMVYGYKVVKPQALAAGYVKQG